MVKKIIIVCILLLLSNFVFADDIFTQEEIDQVNFDTLNLQYEFSQIFLSLDDGKWELWTTVSFITLEPIGNNEYVFGFEARKYTTININFFQCLIDGINDLDCFITHIIPEWTPGFIMNDLLQRRYLKSLQTGGTPMISNELQNYLIGEVS